MGIINLVESGMGDYNSFINMTIQQLSDIHKVIISKQQEDQLSQAVAK